ncbi:translation initiation factor IF-2 [Mucispirillum schaedleri ASF457]|jgi:translation initiation factor IF-2|uniref:Translation initiation factor IF-2 n=1 Tax=Mucispirillum schaedleri ASF457 TaxID=1379858 RepID=V2Q9N6_9BACT|nr:translation initiation factor IF-2 [Mucispirillum schaedleri]USF23363.1 Translation initiation factor IF-2 [Mucispirillum schaedleri ASF457]SIW05191.1 translation initiation factor IF-2 [Mucispirillum schaedleri ASF457]
MALKKVSDVAKNAGISIEETVKVLQASGVQVSNGNDTVKDEDVTAAGLDKRGQLDRRQEMLQKALERHKKGVKIKEVVVSNKNTGGSQQDGPNIKLSKEELKKRKKLMEQHIKKVDEDRIQYNKEKAAQQYNPQSVKKTTVKQETKEMQTVSTDVKTTAVNQNNNTANQNNTIASNNNEASKNSHKQSYNKNTQSRQNFQNKNQDRSKEQKKDDRKDKPFNKNKPSDKNKSFSKDRNEKTDRQFNKDRDKSDKRFQDRDKNSSSDRFRDNKGGKNQQTGGQQRMGNDNVFIAVDEDRKRIVKKKEDENKDKDKESKKTKSKKDSKRSKSWIKTINEGMDELTIENEVDSSPAISPNIDISDLLDVDPDRQPKNNNFNKNRLNKKVNKKQDKSQIKAFVRPEKIEIGEYIVISEFGSLIGVKTTELIKKLFSMGIMASVNQSIDAESAQLLGLEYGVEVTIKTITEDDLLPVYDDKEEDLEKRPPIVTVMGHVDHGKTSLLDAIRSTSVVSGEAGGITQHIGAYEVECSNGTVTFLDTPGHEAFTTLRARGALLTDIVILVVAADDGVKPQTKEAIDHAKAAGVRIVVAINKIDKDGANSDKVKQQLAEYGIIPEEWGGDYQFQEISAKKRLHIDDLLDRVMLEAEILDLKGNKNRPAEGVVIESRLDKQKGPVATVLVKNGTLRRGDTFISGSQFGKVRAMFNYKGLSIKDAGLSIPAEVMGFSELPEAGEKFIVTDEKTAKQVTELRAKLAKEQQMADRGKLSLADFFSKMKDGELKELNIVLKADAQGSLEALSSSLLKLSNKEVKVSIIHDGIGAINESDISLAVASSAIIIGFNVRPDAKAKQSAEREKINIELYSVIYKAIDDVKLALEGLLSPEVKENIIGHIEIRQIFSAPKVGKIAGCFVTDGKVTRNSSVRVIRDSIVIFDGKLSSLKRFTDDVKEVVAGYECGLTIEKYQDIKENDVLEVYEVVEEKRTLEDVAKDEKEK